MAQGKNTAPTSLYRDRRSFAKIPDVMDVPNLCLLYTSVFGAIVACRKTMMLDRLLDATKAAGERGYLTRGEEADLVLLLGGVDEKTE